MVYSFPWIPPDSLISDQLSYRSDSAEHATIARAMQAIADNTCIKFERRAGEADYVDLRNERGEGWVRRSLIP